MVPFESPALFAARVRADQRDGMVVLMRNFAANGSVYVLPWRNVPDCVPVTSFDRALHGAISETTATTPLAVRAAVRQVVAARERPGAQPGAGLPGEARLLTEIHLTLLAEILQERRRPAAPDGTGPDGAGAPNGTGAERLARLLRDTAARTGRKASELFSTTECLARDLLPVGTPTAPGPLRRLQWELTTFVRDLQRRAEAAPVEARGYHQRMARAAVETLGCSTAWLRKLDGAITRMLTTVTDAGADQRRHLREGVDRLAWLQDGWEAVLDRYAKYVERQEGGVRESELALIAALVPLLPEDALARPRNRLACGREAAPPWPRWWPVAAARHSRPGVPAAPGSRSARWICRPRLLGRARGGWWWQRPRPDGSDSSPMSA